MLLGYFTGREGALSRYGEGDSIILETHQSCFSSRLELFHLAIPFVVAIGLSLSESPGWQGLIVGIVFMQLAHTALTYLMLSRLPEFVAWSRAEKRLVGPTRPGAWALSIGLLLCFILIYKIGPYFLADRDSQVLILMLAWVTGLLQYQHFFAQNTGFQSIYDEVLRRSGARPVHENRKQLERWLLTLVFWWGIFQVFGFPLVKLMRRFLGVELSAQALDQAQWISGLLLFVPVLLILLNTALGAHGWKSAKWVYQLRLLFWPLSFLNAKWGFVLLATHSVEYVLLSRQMIQNSKAEVSEKKELWRWAWILIVVFSLISLPSATIFGWWLQPRFGEYRVIFSLFSAAAILISFYHYYLDALLFRMKDPEVRALIGPLIGERK